MSGRPETTSVIPGQWALSVGMPDLSAPPGWEWVKLTDIARLETGHTPSRDLPEYWNGEIPWIGIRDAREFHGGVIDSTQQQVTQAGIDNSAARVLPPGTVCLSRTASVGYVVVMGRAMATSQDFVNWVCSDALDPHFLKYLLIAERESLRRFSKGSTHSTIYFPEVKAFHVCIPGIAEQRRIVAKLDALLASSRAARAAITAVPPLSAQLTGSVMELGLSGRLTDVWRERHAMVRPAGDALDALATANASDRRRVRLWGSGRGSTTADDLPGLPATWTWAQVGTLGIPGEVVQIGPMSMKSSEFTETGHVVLNVGCVRDGWIDVRKADHLPPERARDFRRYMLRTDDVVFTRSGSVGRCALLPAAVDGALMTFHLLRVRVDPRVCLPAYLTLALRGSRVVSRQVQDAAIGATRAGFNTRLLSDLWIPLPPVLEQIAVLEAVDARVQSITHQQHVAGDLLAGLQALEAAVFAKAFRGELVLQDPVDESASALLARIRGERAAPVRAARRRVSTGA